MLALGGVAPAGCGMLLGEIYAVYISHAANGLIKQNWSDVIQAAVAGLFCLRTCNRIWVLLTAAASSSPVLI
jgi:hypothetical protein